MNAEQKIRKAMRGIMEEGEVNAAQVFKSWAYDRDVNFGWHFTKFGSTPTYMGDTLIEALKWLKEASAIRK